MNKKFLSAILFGALMVASTGTFVSCKDYDDEIDDLQEQINKLATKEDMTSQIASLQSALTAAQSEAAAAKASAEDAVKKATDASSAATEAEKAAAQAALDAPTLRLKLSRLLRMRSLKYRLNWKLLSTASLKLQRMNLQKRLLN